MNVMRAVAFLLVLICGVTSVNAQDFEEWKRRQEQEFQAYKDKFDEEFINMLKATWEEVGVNTGSKYYEKEKPQQLPVFTPSPKPRVENIRPQNHAIEDKVKIDLNIDVDDPPLPAPRFTVRQGEVALFEGHNVSPVLLRFFSTSIPLSYPKRITSRLNPADYRNGHIDNQKIATFWEEVSSVDHTLFVKYTLELKEELGLNDWGYILLVNSISKSIFGTNNSNLVRLMNWFILTKAGYQNRVGYDQNGVYNLFTVVNNIFNTKYYTLDGNKFFPINFNEEYQTPSSIFTYQGRHEAQVKKLDLGIDTYPQFITANNQIRKELNFEFQGRAYSIPLTLNRDVVSYFEYYPLTDLQIFFAASMSPYTKKQLYTTLKPILENMDEVQAVNFLLKMVQTSFGYKTDQDQFNREKYMVAEETFFYPYSDCDDRSILFATLVQELLGLDVVGVRYSRHLAVAIHFNSEVEGDYYMSHGKKYVVADPTYINAPVGLTMPSYRAETPTILTFN